MHWLERGGIKKKHHYEPYDKKSIQLDFSNLQPQSLHREVLGLEEWFFSL